MAHVLCLNCGCPGCFVGVYPRGRSLCVADLKPLTLGSRGTERQKRQHSAPNLGPTHQHSWGHGGGWGWGWGQEREPPPPPHHPRASAGAGTGLGGLWATSPMPSRDCALCPTAHPCFAAALLTLPNLVSRCRTIPPGLVGGVCSLGEARKCRPLNAKAMAPEPREAKHSRAPYPAPQLRQAAALLQGLIVVHTCSS